MQENSLPSTPNSNAIDQAQFEADKRAVYKHPLFSLLALMLEKCEQATQGYIPKSTSSSPNGISNSSEESDTFTRDIQAFVQLMKKENRPLLTNDPELDGLMIKALQVLRIHLLELEKVQDLCRDFCTRYIACLRGKMQSENLLRSGYPLEHSSLSDSNSPINSPEADSLNGQASSNYYASDDIISNSQTNDFNNVRGTFNFSSQKALISAEQSPININELNHSNNNSVTSKPNTIVEPEITNPQILESNAHNELDCAPLSLENFSNQLAGCTSSDEEDSEGDGDEDSNSNYSYNSGLKRQKRGILPKQATSIMRAWLFQHLVHPYPTEDEKRAIAAQTNLTLLQVNNWFINARRRILQPMLEQANDSNHNSGTFPEL